MPVTTTTHLNFRGAAREALDFYRSVFGGRTATVTYKDAGNVQNESEADWVMWGEVAGDNGFHVMAYDVTSAVIGPRTMDHLDDLLAGALLTLGDDVLDRIDAIVPPGTDISPPDVSCTPPSLSRTDLRRRPPHERAAA
ncbi:hypothetical protein GCM10017673_09950 [Streptosporangium violaceochromogenes]|nr:hypothetical protein GCM10017673_09950 [Streptosporangium violaceochromogenes]